jgi:ATP-dependent protease ClpP protease subunit
MSGKTVRRTVSQRSELINDVHEHAVNPDSREIWLHGYVANVEDEPGVEYRMAVQFEKNIALLTSLSPKDAILVRMHTTGGEWEDGMGIYDAISTCCTHVTILAYGHATSMSSIILQAADKRVLMPNTHVMVHHGSQSISSSSSAFIAWGDWEKRLIDVMVNIYAERCAKGPYYSKKKSMTLEKVKIDIQSHMDKKQDWIMDAEEAVDFGFADGIYGYEGWELKDLLTY